MNGISIFTASYQRLLLVKKKEVRPHTAKVGLVAYENYGIVKILLYEYLEESPNCIYTLHSMFIINLHEQEYKFVQYFDLANNWHFFAHPSLAPLLDRKFLVFGESSESSLIYVCSNKNWSGRL